MRIDIEIHGGDKTPSKDALYDAILVGLMSEPRVPFNEEGYERMRALFARALESVDAVYQIDIEPLTDEDKRLRRAPRIKIKIL